MMNHFKDYRHVDVAILYGLGQKDRAQHIARKLRPPKLVKLGTPDTKPQSHPSTTITNTPFRNYRITQPDDAKLGEPDIRM